MVARRSWQLWDWRNQVGQTRVSLLWKRVLLHKTRVCRKTTKTSPGLLYLHAYTIVSTHEIYLTHKRMWVALALAQSLLSVSQTWQVDAGQLFCRDLIQRIKNIFTHAFISSCTTIFIQVEASLTTWQVIFRNCEHQWLGKGLVSLRLNFLTRANHRFGKVSRLKSKEVTSWPVSNLARMVYSNHLSTLFL